jgi:hypothetical protein
MPQTFLAHSSSARWRILRVDAMLSGSLFSVEQTPFPGFQRAGPQRSCARLFFGGLSIIQRSHFRCIRLAAFNWNHANLARHLRRKKRTAVRHFPIGIFNTRNWHTMPMDYAERIVHAMQQNVGHQCPHSSLRIAADHISAIARGMPPSHNRRLTLAVLWYA